MAFEYKKRIANRRNYGYSRTTKNIAWLVVHFTANDGDSDEANAKYFENNIVKASAHYFIDDDSVTQSVPDNYVAYSVGGNKYPNTKGGKYFAICNNTNSLNIELCDTVKNGKNDLSAKTRANAIEFIKQKVKKYKIDRNHVIRHYDVNGKPCPGIIGYNTDSGSDNLWNSFKDRLRLKTGSSGSTSTTSGSVDKLYYVQVGAFKSKSNAEEYLNKKVKPVYSYAFINENAGYYYVQVGAFRSVINANNCLKAAKVHFPDAFIKRF